MLLTETKINSIISFSEFLPNGYNDEFRRDRCKNGRCVMIVTKQEYTIILTLTSLLLPNITVKVFGPLLALKTTPKLWQVLPTGPLTRELNQF